MGQLLHGSARPGTPVGRNDSDRRLQPRRLGMNEKTVRVGSIDLCDFNALQRSSGGEGVRPVGGPRRSPAFIGLQVCR